MPEPSRSPPTSRSAVTLRKISISQGSNVTCVWLSTTSGCTTATVVRRSLGRRKRQEWLHATLRCVWASVGVVQRGASSPRRAKRRRGRSNTPSVTSATASNPSKDKAHAVSLGPNDISKTTMHGWDSLFMGRETKQLPVYSSLTSKAEDVCKMGLQVQAGGRAKYSAAPLELAGAEFRWRSRRASRRSFVERTRVGGNIMDLHLRCLRRGGGGGTLAARPRISRQGHGHLGLGVSRGSDRV